VWAGPAKRQTGAALCLNRLKTTAKSGKARNRETAAEATGSPAKRANSDAPIARLKIVVSPGSSPGLAIRNPAFRGISFFG
jgi:hypothetical protein